jgi:hypothetical protein
MRTQRPQRSRVARSNQLAPGFNEAQLAQLIESNATFEQFFAQAQLHPNAVLITGSICGYKIEEINHFNRISYRYEHRHPQITTIATVKKVMFFDIENNTNHEHFFRAFLYLNANTTVECSSEKLAPVKPYIPCSANLLNN